VSVIIPVCNVEPYLRECLDSVLGQTIGLARIEVIAVDDGSTDGSGVLLDEYAASHPEIRAFHEPNSGGPGRPRNVGLDHATGTYVFFLDADDYLGPEALERLVGMAERNATDIVLGKMVGVAGRPVPTRAFCRTRARATLDTVYGTLTVLKLFRRALIERLGLRFTEGMAGGEDAPFTARAYFEADGISVVADYDCYYCRARPDSQSRGGGGRKDDLVQVLGGFSSRMELVARYRRPGPGRDRLMIRHVLDVVRPFSQQWLDLPPDERRRVFDAAAALIRRWHTKLIQDCLAPGPALRAHCLQHGLTAELEDIVACSARSAYANAVAEGGRVFAGYPHFRASAGIPDSCYEITERIELLRPLARAAVVDGTLRLSGTAYLSLLGGSATIILRRWPRGPELRFPTESTPTCDMRDRDATYPNAGFAVAINVASAAHGRPLASGSWDIVVSVGTDRVRREARWHAPRAEDPAATAPHPGEQSDPLGALYVTPAGLVRLRIGPVRPTVRWLERGERVAVGLERRWRRLRQDVRRLGRLWSLPG
jgi:CDP-glycerol glycerophosphotransferase